MPVKVLVFISTRYRGWQAPFFVLSRETFLTHHPVGLCGCKKEEHWRIFINSLLDGRENQMENL
jgi:hypothetical protein